MIAADMVFYVALFYFILPDVKLSVKQIFVLLY